MSFGVGSGNQAQRQEECFVLHMLPLFVLIKIDDFAEEL